GSHWRFVATMAALTYPPAIIVVERFSMNNRALLILFVVSLAGGCSGKPQPSSTERGASRPPAASTTPATRLGPGDWLPDNVSLAGDRYSPLDQLPPSNVTGLRQV